MCQYCETKNSKGDIAGKEFKVNKTLVLQEKSNTDNLVCFILKGEADIQAGIMIGTFEGYHYININYCPMCRKRVERS